MLKEYIKKWNGLWWIMRSIRERIKLYGYRHGKLDIVNYSPYKIKKHVKGEDNKLRIGKNVFLNNPTIRVIGNHNCIVFDDNVTIGPKCSFWCEGDNIEIHIGKGTSFTTVCHINAQENNSKIIIGEDCMFSNNIIVRTSDSHPIYDIKTGMRINPAKNIIIGRHVWIAPQTIIMKGVTIGEESIVGSRTIVTKDIPSHCLAVGTPAKVVKENILWTRENIINLK